MGTMHSDITYQGLAHAAPPSVSSHTTHYIEARWKEWLPYCTVEARRYPDPSSVLHVLKTKNHSRLVDLLSAHIPWDTIRKHRLDDPLTSNEAFQFQLRAAVERRRTRMGRVKGIHRGKGV